MQVSVTNLTNVIVPLTIIDGNGKAAPYGLQPLASNVSLTVPDGYDTDLSSMRAEGLIAYTITVFPYIAANYAAGKVGRTFVTATTYTVAAADSGNVIDWVNASASTVTLPNNLPRGFAVSVLQAGAGQITFAAGSGATLHMPGATTKTASQWALVQAFVRDNVGGSAAEWVVFGATA